MYFRCKAHGVLLDMGDGTENIRWVEVGILAQWIKKGRDQFSGVDFSGLSFYLKSEDRKREDMR